MNRPLILAALVLAAMLAVAALLLIPWHDGAGGARRAALQALTRFQSALDSPDPRPLLDTVVVIPALKTNSPAEQADFIRNALAQQVSSEGIAALAKHATFGPLYTVFPRQAARWAFLAGVPLTNCVAFRLQREGFAAEVVLCREGKSYKVMRCNNVRPLAQP